MKRSNLGLILLGATGFMTVPAQASDAYQQGMSLAQSIPLPQPGSPENVPGYEGTNLSQSQIKAHDLGEHSFKASKSDEASQLISENHEKGERFVIDPHTDPLILAGNEITNNPQKILGETIVETEGGGVVAEEVKTCEEAGDEFLEECEEVRIVTVPEIQKHRSSFTGTPYDWKLVPTIYRNCNVITGETWCPYNYGYCYYNFNLVNPVPVHLRHRIKSYQFAPGYSPVVPMSLGPHGLLHIPETPYRLPIDVPIEFTFLPDEKDVSETIKNNCHHWEEQVEKGLCSYEDVVVIEGPQTCVINELPVTRDWWRRKKIYRCRYPAKNDCAGLRSKGCYQVKSACKQKVANTCVVWEQTYNCPHGRVVGKTYRSSNKENPFCLSGDCADKSYMPNSDFVQVMAHMSVLKEAGDDLKNLGTIFKGQDRRCTRHCVGFKDCCGNGNGWGVSLKLASCDATEKELAELRSKNRCIHVGTYCAEKKVGVCIRKKTSFCCYGTKLAKIVQEQGKRQLGLGFGSPEHPDCQGLTAEQLSNIDFSQIDFSEILSEVMGRTKTPTSEKLVSGIQQSMETKGSLLKNPDKGPKSLPETTTPSETTHVQGHPRDQF